MLQTNLFPQKRWMNLQQFFQPLLSWDQIPSKIDPGTLNIAVNILVLWVFKTTPRKLGLFQKPLSKNPIIHQPGFHGMGKFHPKIDPGTLPSQRISKSVARRAFFDTQVFFGVRVGQISWTNLINFHGYYCWWLKSCTTKDDEYPIIYRVSCIPGGARFQPSTVSIHSGTLR